MKIKAYSTSETSYLLRKYLGPLRAWDDFLADCRRGKTSLFGYTLTPIGRVETKKIRYLPAYEAIDIVTFIQDVRKACPEAAANIAPSPIMLEIDFADRRFWRVRKLAPAA